MSERARREISQDTLTSLELAKKVLRIEAAAILGLLDRLNGDFDRAVQLLYECRGRVIVTGMGKSGIICRKIAATFLHAFATSSRFVTDPSTALTPASFIHSGTRDAMTFKFFSPAARKFRTICAPKNPVPPVMRIRFSFFVRALVFGIV